MSDFVSTYYDQLLAGKEVPCAAGVKLTSSNDNLSQEFDNFQYYSEYIRKQADKVEICFKDSAEVDAGRICQVIGYYAKQNSSRQCQFFDSILIRNKQIESINTTMTELNLGKEGGSREQSKKKEQGKFSRSDRK